MNPYALRLQEYSSFVFNEQSKFQFKKELESGWRNYFSTRLSFVPKQLILEIGCSNAVFLSTISKLFPKDAFIGMDWKYKVLFKGAQKIAEQNIKNTALLRGKAQEISKIFAPQELDEAWIFFPDPWPKRSQSKHRLIQKDFLIDLHRSMKKNGCLYFKTDHPGYYLWVLSIFGEPLPELKGYEFDPEERIDRNTRQVRARAQSPDGLPKKSEDVVSRFKIEERSLDYWSDVEKLSPSKFNSTKTLFEKGFCEQNLPIFYLKIVSI